MALSLICENLGENSWYVNESTNEFDTISIKNF